MTAPEFVDELPGRPGGVWQDRLAPLLERPGRWARVDVRDTSPKAARAAWSLRKNRHDIPAGRWDFASRTVDGVHGIYACYLGPEQEVSA